MSRLDDLVEKYKLGEIEFDVVLEETKPLIAKLSRRIGIRDWELDDYFQEGAIILFNCIDKYEENHTTSFTSYFSNNIKWKLFRIHNTQTLIRVPAWIAEKSGYQRFNFISNIQSNGKRILISLIYTYPKTVLKNYLWQMLVYLKYFTI